MNGMDEEARDRRDRLHQLLSERVESLERTIRLLNTQVRSLEIAVQNHQRIFEAVSAGAGKSAPD